MKKYIIIALLFFNINLKAKLENPIFNKLNFVKNTKNLTGNSAETLTVDKIFEELENEDAQFVMLSFVDILGDLKEIIIPINKAKSAFDNGLTFDSSSVAGYSNIENSDMIIKPDLNTLRFLPWTDNIHKTAWFMCDVYKEPNIPYEADTRYILKNLLKGLDQLNYRFNTGIELEFLLFSKAEPVDNKSYLDAETQYSKQQEAHILIHTLNSIGVDVEKLHHEVSPGQYEISINYGDALNIADQIIAMKYAIQVIANQLDYKVSFMAKPLYGKNGSAMHIHYSLYNKTDKQNAFYSADGQYQISDIAKMFLAGNIKYIKDFSAILNPTINSYKRLVKDFEAPVYNFWGVRNRSALFRLPLLHQEPIKSTRIELRSPDPSTNPYLAFAALLKTGLQGIKENLDLIQPINLNVFELSQDELKSFNIETLPQDLTQALDLLEKSSLAKELLTESGLDLYIKLKNKMIKDFNTAITEFELR